MDEAAALTRHHFANANDRLVIEFEAIRADRVAHGQGTQTTTVMKPAIRMVDELYSVAVDRALADVANKVTTRGREWHHALSAVRAETVRQLKMARELIVKIFPFAAAEMPVLLAKEFERIEQKSREKIANFEAGWSAPTAKGWHERRPVTHAILLLIVGAVAGAVATSAVEKGWSAFWGDDHPSPCVPAHGPR